MMTLIWLLRAGNPVGRLMVVPAVPVWLRRDAESGLSRRACDERFLNSCWECHRGKIGDVGGIASDGEWRRFRSSRKALVGRAARGRPELICEEAFRDALRGSQGRSIDD